MQTYICKNCDDLLCETSICPVCGKRAELLRTEIYYCSHCNCPTYDDICPVCKSKCEKIGTDVRPVFAEERLLIEVLLDKPFCFEKSSIWCVNANNYVIDGKKVKMPFSEFRTHDSKVIIEKLNKYKSKNIKNVENDFSNKHIGNFIKCNQNHLNIITDEAFNYIKDISKNFDVSSMFVSFSGGKDSTVTSNLVIRSLGNESIPHIYGDTTLEYPESKKYIEIFKKNILILLY